MNSFNCKHYYNNLHIFVVTSFLVCSLYPPKTSLARAQYINVDNSDSDSDLTSDSIWNPLYTGIVATVLTIFFILFYYTAYTCFIRFCWQRPDPVPDQPGRGGLDPAILVAFPVFTYSDVEGLGLTKGPLGPVECAVCLSPFEEKDTLRLLSKCYHVFHLHCVDRWLAAHTTCPLCRANLVTLPGETSRVESGSVDESGSIILSGVAAVESDHTPEGKFIGKIWRWNSTGHLTEIGWEEGEVRSGLRSPESVRKDLVASNNLTRSSSCIITLWT
ncbi:E3 ubiquitin-protein ligase ATL6-like [Spinacia oleracea]|uniref:RING-type E3 ubiquitin transferase n=1 Tax=Spinacia oleracea TaxID=3562 RepID=A0A9R0JTW0_SPIOL|nr:E3 ubiquitin-protein ligase ATL6-like [Spinacia oleracea]